MPSSTAAQPWLRREGSRGAEGREHVLQDDDVEGRVVMRQAIERRVRDVEEHALLPGGAFGPLDSLA